MKIHFLSLLLLFADPLVQAAAPLAAPPASPLASPSAASMDRQMLALNLKDRSWSEELRFLQDFAAANEAACKSWSPQAFRTQKYLADSCQFSPLLKRYMEKLKALPHSEQSGVALPAVPLKDSTLPILQSGAWQSLIMSDVDGFKSALEIIVLRIALQKSLLAHANLIREETQGLFNPFAAVVIPRMLSSLSGYSQTLQRLVFIDAFQCGTAKTFACQDSKALLNRLRKQIILGIGPADFLAGFGNMTKENSGRDFLKARQAQQVIKLLQRLKSETSLQDLLKNLEGKKSSPVFTELNEQVAAMTSAGLVASSVEQSSMLVAVSILSEILEMQTRVQQGVSASDSQGPPGVQARKTTEELNRLKSFVLTVLRNNEVITDVGI